MAAKKASRSSDNHHRLVIHLDVDGELADAVKAVNLALDHGGLQKEVEEADTDEPIRVLSATVVAPKRRGRPPTALPEPWSGLASHLGGIANLAKECEASPLTVWRWATKRSRPTAVLRKHVMKLAEDAGVDPDGLWPS